MIRPRYGVCAMAAALLALAWAAEVAAIPGALLLGGWILAIVLSVVDIGWALRLLPVTFERELAPRLALGRDHAVWVTLHNPGARRLRVHYHEQLAIRAASARVTGLPRQLKVPARHSTRFAYGLRPSTRGLLGLDACALYVSGPLGLWEVRHLLHAPQRSRVSPDVTALVSTAGQAFSSPPIHSPKAAGAPADLVLWIDTGAAMASTRHGERLLDHAIDAAVALACNAMAQGGRVALHLAGDPRRGYIPPGRGDRHFQALYQLLEDPPLSLQPTDWAASAANLLEHAGRRTVVVLITRLPAEGDLGALRALVAVAQTHRLIVADVMEQTLLAPARAAVRSNRCAHDYCLATQAIAQRERLGVTLRAAGAEAMHVPGVGLPEMLVARYAQPGSGARLRPRRSGEES